MAKVREAHSKFVDHLKSQGRSSATVLAYGKDIEQLSDFLEALKKDQVHEISTKDLQAFIHIAEKNGYDFRLLREVERINQEQIEGFFQEIKHAVWVLKGKRIAAWGLAFKPGTDDVRFAPALAVIEKLLAEGAIVAAYDPQAVHEAQAVLPPQENRMIYCKSAEEAAAHADALVLFTEWQEFRSVDLERLRGTMARPLVIDGRNMFSSDEMRRLGFEYSSIGRP